MADENIAGSLITYTVKINGDTIPVYYQLYSIHVEQAVNRITTAKVVLLDGSAAKEDFKVSETDYFKPGNEVVIEAGYDSKNKVIFNGVMTKLGLKIEEDSGSALEFECKDKAIKMIVGRKNATYTKTKDSDVIAKLIRNNSLTAKVSSTSPQLAELVQYYCSDWDFILSRAEVNGMLVTTIDGKVTVFDPTSSTKSVLTVTYGKNLYSLNAEMNAVTQLSKVTASAWDFKNQALINTSNSNNFKGPGNISSDKLADVIGLNNFQLQTPVAEIKDELSLWSKAQILKSNLSKITGEVRFQGTSEISAGQYITLEGVGNRFNGDHFVSKVAHEIIDGNWFINAEIGLAPNWFIQEPDVVAPTASGLLPGVQGLHSGKVKKIYEDPDSGYRILINLPLLDPDQKGIWARLSNFSSSKGFGAFFLPEVDDEVIVGFLNDDPRYPVILGSMYSQNVKPFSEFKPNKKNSHKGIVTKSETRLVFNDEDKIITITTPAKNTVQLDDKNKKISITDQNNNLIVMSSTGIEIKSPKNITISADQKVIISGNTGVEIKSSGGDVSSSGVNIKQNANIQFAAKGGASAEVNGGAQLTLKAAMVMIN